MPKCPCCNNKIHSYTILVNNFKKKDIICSKCNADLKCIKNTFITVVIRIISETLTNVIDDAISEYFSDKLSEVKLTSIFKELHCKYTLSKSENCVNIQIVARVTQDLLEEGSIIAE